MWVMKEKRAFNQPSNPTSSLSPELVLVGSSIKPQSKSKSSLGLSQYTLFNLQVVQLFVGLTKV